LSFSCLSFIWSLYVPFGIYNRFLLYKKTIFDIIKVVFVFI
jgi:hypothetical protein